MKVTIDKKIKIVVKLSVEEAEIIKMVHGKMTFNDFKYITNGTEEQFAISYQFYSQLNQAIEKN